MRGFRFASMPSLHRPIGELMTPEETGAASVNGRNCSAKCSAKFVRHGLHFTSGDALSVEKQSFM